MFVLRRKREIVKNDEFEALLMMAANLRKINCENFFAFFIDKLQNEAIKEATIFQALEFANCLSLMGSKCYKRYKACLLF